MGLDRRRDGRTGLEVWGPERDGVSGVSDPLRLEKVLGWFQCRSYGVGLT